MNTYHFIHSFQVTSNGLALTPEDLHNQGEQLMDELLKLEGCNAHISDPAVSTEVHEEHTLVLVDIAIGAGDESTAVAEAKTILRTAIHATGGSTPNWDHGTRPSAHAYEPSGFELVYA